jgi:hypothetical protein
MVVAVTVVADTADLAGAHGIAHRPPHRGQRGGHFVEIVVRLGRVHDPLPTMHACPASA